MIFFKRIQNSTVPGMNLLLKLSLRLKRQALNLLQPPELIKKCENTDFGITIVGTGQRRGKIGSVRSRAPEQLVNSPNTGTRKKVPKNIEPGDSQNPPCLI